MTRAVELRQLFKAFNGNEVLRGVDLGIEEGEILTILGGSGTGKSVLLRLMIGLFKPDAGQILIEAEDIVPLREDELLKMRRKVGMLFQGAALFDSMSVKENVAFPLREHTGMTEGQIRDRVGEVLALVGMAGTEEKYPVELSGGMRKRVGLARAIALTPRIVLYDEPTTGLDPRNVDKINELITDLRAKLRVASVVVTHDLQSAFRISDRVALLSEGRIAATGSPAEIGKTEDPVVQEFLAGHL
ncbi:MAG: ABC transporter ATP-binding protein [candidate division NC10 bacterium]|jgi:phospholipid/cholesterol/gamma-HCH transport system ATP-binding protein